MAELNPPLYQDVDFAYSGDELGLPWHDAISEGVVGSGDLAVSQRAAGANMSVDIAPGAAWVRGDDNAAAQPTYRVRSDSVVNLAIAAADPTNPRIDRVVAEVLDATFSGTQRLWRLRVLTGTPTSGATLANQSGGPAPISNAATLGNVLVPAGSVTVTNANIDTALYSVGAGGAIRSKATLGFLYPRWNAGTAVAYGAGNLDAVRPRITLADFTTLSNPYPGMEVAVQISADIFWVLRYEPAYAGNTFPWVFVGGTPLLSFVFTGESGASGTPADLTTVGPSITMPRGGDYIFQWGSRISLNSGTVGGYAQTQLMIGGSASGYDNIATLDAVGYFHQAANMARFSGGIGAGTVCKLQYSISNTVSTLWAERWLSCVPVKVSQT